MSGRSKQRIAVTALCAFGALVMVVPAFAGNSGGSSDEPLLTALAMNIENAPNPVLAVDGKNHLAYEITIVNQSGSDVTIDRVQPRAKGKRFGSALDGAALADLLRVNPNGAESFIPAGGSALLFMDVTYGKNRKAPRRLKHAFDTTLADPDGVQPDQQLHYVGVPTKVGRKPAIRVEAPLRGPRWVVANGCCNPINAHRGATLSINGTVHVAQRFAIDFVGLNEDGTLIDGPIDELSSYNYFGSKIHSATVGKVVRITDDLPEQIPGMLPGGQTVQTADGNYVVVKIDSGHYAFYAHMQPGSLRVEVGDRVRTGKVLGLLGNTGNTDGPHLHFHIMDGASPLESNGLPFVYKRFSGQGHISNGDSLQEPDFVADVDTSSQAGRFRNRMPLGFQLIDFAK